MDRKTTLNKISSLQKRLSNMRIVIDTTTEEKFDKAMENLTFFASTCYVQVLDNILENFEELPKKKMKRNSKGMSGHQSAKMKTDTYLTPPEILKALGTFDLDPCSPVNRPWDTARMHYTAIEVDKRYMFSILHYRVNY